MSMLNWSTTSRIETRGSCATCPDAMATMTAFEAKTRFGELLERVAKGEEIVITRHEKPVARIVPEGAPRPDIVRRAVAGLEALQQTIHRRSRARLSDRQARAAIDAGRL